MSLKENIALICKICDLGLRETARDVSPGMVLKTSLSRSLDTILPDNSRAQNKYRAFILNAMH